MKAYPDNEKNSPQKNNIKFTTDSRKTIDVDTVGRTRLTYSTVVFYHIQVAHLAIVKKCILEHSKKFVSTRSF